MGRMLLNALELDVNSRKARRELHIEFFKHYDFTFLMFNRFIKLFNLPDVMQ